LKEDIEENMMSHVLLGEGTNPPYSLEKLITGQEYLPGVDPLKMLPSCRNTSLMNKIFLVMYFIKFK